MTFITLNEINSLLREIEISEQRSARERLVAYIAILRSVIQREIATNEGIEAALAAYNAKFGEPTTENVDAFVDGLSFELREKPIPYKYVEEILDAD